MSRRVQTPKDTPESASKPSPSKFNVPFPVVALLIAVVFVAAVALLRRPSDTLGDRPLAAAAEQSAKTPAGVNVEATATLPPDRPRPAGEAPFAGRPDTVTSAPVVPEEPEPEQNAVIDHLIDDFRGYQKQLDGYKLDGVVQTNDGITLSKKDDDGSSESEDGYRRGVLESPVLPFNHPSNAVQPIWRVELPNSDTSFHVEVSLSADGDEWTEWNQVEPSGDDISPTYPDGRPNPNYGARAGNAMAHGLSLYPYMRYRVTLASTNETDTPLLQEFKVTYLDSTDGQGYLASEEPEVPEVQNPNASAPAVPDQEPTGAAGPSPDAPQAPAAR